MFKNSEELKETEDIMFKAINPVHITRYFHMISMSKC